MQFTDSRTTSGAKFRKHKLVQVAALRNMKLVEELFMSCGEMILLQQVSSKHFFEKCRKKNEESKNSAG